MHFAANDIFSFCFRIFCFLLFSFFNHHYYCCSPSIGGASFNPLDDSQQQRQRQRKDIRQRLECDVHFFLLSSVWRRFVSHFREREVKVQLDWIMPSPPLPPLNTARLEGNVNRFSYCWIVFAVVITLITTHTASIICANEQQKQYFSVFDVG